MKFIKIDKNVISGQCYNAWVRIQIRYTAIFIGVGLIPNGWQGLQFGIFAPAHSPKHGYCLKAFYADFLPAIPGPVTQWPNWYRRLKLNLLIRKVLAKGYV
jgi:hypothetical protein